MLIAERAAWREISRMMHLGSTLNEALEKLQSALLFWQREVYEKIQRPGPSWDRSVPRQPFRQAKGKGWSKGKFSKGKGPRMPRQPKGGQKGGFSKSKTKSKSEGHWPSNWARKTPKGLDFCYAYHLKGQCTGTCGRSHNCPVMKADGWVCTAPPEKHSPKNCPNL